MDAIKFSHRLFYPFRYFLNADIIQWALWSLDFGVGVFHEFFLHLYFIIVGLAGLAGVLN